VRILFIVLSLAALCACATVQKLDAAADVHALLVAIRDDDAPTFDALVDRRALKAEIRDRLVAEAGKDRNLSGLAAILAPGIAELAGEALIRPDVFRGVAAYYGYGRDTKIPPSLYIARMLRPLPDGRVCAVGKTQGDCILVFTHAADGRWKLSGFGGDLSMLRLKR
jgi:hypothetical protein